MVSISRGDDPHGRGFCPSLDSASHDDPGDDHCSGSAGKA